LSSKYLSALTSEEVDNTSKARPLEEEAEAEAEAAAVAAAITTGAFRV
jgi:hypothetical protein